MLWFLTWSNILFSILYEQASLDMLEESNSKVNNYAAVLILMSKFILNPSKHGKFVLMPDSLFEMPIVIDILIS